MGCYEFEAKVQEDVDTDAGVGVESRRAFLRQYYVLTGTDPWAEVRRYCSDALAVAVLCVRVADLGLHCMLCTFVEIVSVFLRLEPMRPLSIVVAPS
ncbi:MAG: hypothetical protein ACKPKO_24260, partial [Candidatus Fonsibacter sp.]